MIQPETIERCLARRSSLALVVCLLAWAPAHGKTAGPARAKTAAAVAVTVPTKVFAPAYAIDEHSIVLAWNKPEDYRPITDYRVYMNGKPLGTASANARAHWPAQAYVDKFYAADAKGIHVKVTPHSFTVEQLKPATRYSFTVRSVLPGGKLSAASPALVVRTAAAPTICDITGKGAKGDGETLNTAAIQDTIDTCPAGGKVLIPAGVFKSGALFLKSDMTLEIADGATLLGSDKPEDYPLARGYKLYEYSTTQRPPSLLNALSSDIHAGAFQNIRILGKGVIDGNGWKRTPEGSITDEAGGNLPQYIAGNNKSVVDEGILAAAQVKQALAEGMPMQAVYGQRRSSLMTLRGVENLYIAGITLRNPAFHGAMVLESEKVMVNGVRFETFDVNNGDGVEFGNSREIIVMNSFFDTGDDCVNFAAGTGEEATSQPPQQFAWIFNNYFRKGHGAVVMGSHTGAWITDILAEDNVINQTWTGLRAKTNNINGGGARRIVYRDNAHRDVQREAIVLTSDYADANALLDYKPAAQPGKFQDFLVQHNSLEFTSSWQPTPITRNGKKVIEEFPPVLVQGDVKHNSFHENIVFDDLLLVNAPPIKIDGLRNGMLSNMNFRGYKTDGMPWKVSNAPGTSMKDVKLEPAEK